MLNRPDLPAEHPANQIPQELLTLGDSKFAPKLSAFERCQVLALRKSGMSKGAIAITFGIDRRTVTHICNPRGTRYRSVRNEADSLGDKAFILKYVTEDLMQRVRAAAATPEGQASDDVDRQTPGAAKVGRVNKHATGKSGISMHKGDGHTFTHRIDVKWVEGKDGFPDGWYADLLDTSEAGQLLGNPDDNSHLTSLSALRYAKDYLDENY